MHILLLKELKLGYPIFVVFLAIVLLGSLFSSPIAGQSHAGRDLAHYIFFLQGLFLPLFILFNLMRDWQLTRHQWIHSPRKGVNLLASKWAAGLVYMLILMILAIPPIVVNTIKEFQVIDEYHQTHDLIYRFLEFFWWIGITLTAAVWTGLGWVAVTTVYNRIKSTAVAASVAFFTIFLYAGSYWLRLLPFIQALTGWGNINLGLPPNHGTTFYIGEHLISLLYLTGLFFLTCWLIDHQLET